MIYQPLPVLDLRIALAQGVIAALTAAVTDFIAEDNKPWAYYVGVFAGASATATGIPNAAATMYVVGDSVDFLLFHSPEGSVARVYLDGVAQSVIDAYNPVPSWITNTVTMAGAILHRIDIVNEVNPNVDKSSNINWLAIGPIQVNGGYALPGSLSNMNLLSTGLKDSEQDTKTASLPIYLPSGFTLAQVQTYADAALAEVDAVTGAQIMEASITFTLTLPGGLKGAPVAASLNERGGLITFDTSGPRRDSVWIPAIKTTIMPGDTFDLANASVAALITRLTTSTTAANIRPNTPQGYNWTAARKGTKSIRKQ